jgi:tetratricopeptide (TPR) repeat protein
MTLQRVHSRRWPRRLAATLAVASAGLLVVPLLHAQMVYDPVTCGEMTNAVGPFDMRTAPDNMRTLVETYHFFTAIQRLEGHRFAIGDNLDYTLRAIPNHPGALRTISRFSSLVGKEVVPGAKHTVECYFARAIELAPDDPAPHMIYGVHLLKLNKVQPAIGELRRAAELGSQDPNIDYNLGLAYIDLRDYDKAKDHAKRAYEAGFPLPGLRDKLTKAGQWP